MSEPIPVEASRWPLARVLVLILAGTFLGLMADLRVEHVDVARHTWLAWIPIVYSAAMAIACIAVVIWWNPVARRLIQIVFLAGFIVGGLGFWLHNHGKIGNVIASSLQAWTDPKMKHPHGPPQIAPLAFAGLGLLGAVGVMKRFDWAASIKE